MNLSVFRIAFSLLIVIVVVSIEADPFPSARDCAARSNKIFGGTETDIDEFPWMALIEYEKSELFKIVSGKFKYVCIL